MVKRPAFQFYPADWRQNANLRRCSEAARGAWMDILCVLHDSDEYGTVRWSLTELARAAGVAVKLAKELVAKAVLKGADSGSVEYIHTPRHAGKDGEPITLVSGEGPIWFSSRMLRDEWRRGVSGGSTRFPTTKPPTLPRQGDNPGDGASSSTSSSSSVAAADPQEEANQIGRLNRILGLSEKDYLAFAANIRVLADMKAEGLDFERHILPAAQACSGRAKSLAYIRPKARELRDAAKIVADMPAPFQNTDERGWQARLQAFRGNGTWPAHWGPKPDETGCKCPAEILRAKDAA